jgi:hypothetical protein
MLAHVEEGVKVPSSACKNSTVASLRLYSHAKMAIY